MLKQLYAPNCPPVKGTECPPTHCRARCALEVIDGLLSMPEGVSGEEVDGLLDLRQILAARTDAEGALRLFCELRRRMEPRHYLAFYRLRRWFETQTVAVVRDREGGPPVLLGMRLQYFCMEAVRRGCLCAASRQGLKWDIPRLDFAFVPLVRSSHPEVALAPKVEC